MSRMSGYDYVIIGKGLVGAAAARYLSKEAKVAIIGPDEPTDFHQSQIFASHYDQARVQRIIGKDIHWTRLNQDAINAYAALEKESGIRFHENMGCLYVNPHGVDAYLKAAPHQATQIGTNPVFYSSEKEINQQFPFLTFPEGTVGMLEEGPAGLINPRKLLQAQLTVAKSNGVTTINEVAVSLKKAGGVFTIVTNKGTTIHAGQVIIATGSYQNFSGLLEQPVAMRSKTESVILIEWDTKDPNTSKIPSILYELVHPEIEAIYVLPPVQYPDGKTYIKIGANVSEDEWFESKEEIAKWFQSGPSTTLSQKLFKGLKYILPSLPENSNYQSKPCVVSYTKHGRPYIGEYCIEGIIIAGGCNGYSAMCSDSIGKLGAFFAQNRSFPEPYEAAAFKIEYPD